MNEEKKKLTVHVPGNKTHRMSEKDAAKCEKLELHYCMTRVELVRWLIRKEHKMLFEGND